MALVQHHSPIFHTADKGSIYYLLRAAHNHIMKYFKHVICTLLSALLLVFTASTSALAHELQASRATLVLRDKQHLSLTFFVDYSSVLHQVIAPQRSYQEFVMMYAAMKPQELQGQLLAAQNKLKSNIAIVLKNGKTVALSQWLWPELATVQTLLQQRAMQAVVAPAGDHTHAAPTEIRAEATATDPQDFTSVTLKLPPEFQQVLLVSYQPKQVWVKLKAASPVINF